MGSPDSGGRLRWTTVLVVGVALLLTSMAASVPAAAENPNDIVDEFSKSDVSESEQLPLSEGKTLFKQSCASCHGSHGQGGYMLQGVETPGISKAAGLTEELKTVDFANATLNEGVTWDDVTYSVIREHIRSPPGIMATAVGTNGWSKDTISVKQADAIARWLMNDAPTAPKPGDFEEPTSTGEEELSNLKDEFPMLSSSESAENPIELGDKLFHRTCKPCHGGTRLKMAGTPGVSTPGEKAPVLAPFERIEEGDSTLMTYYHIREHIRNPPKLMGHWVKDTKTGDTGFSTSVFTKKEADAIAKFVASNEGRVSASKISEETGLPANDESADKIIGEFPKLPESEQISKEKGKQVFQQTCAGCHGRQGQGGYMVQGMETPQLAKANGYVEEIMIDFNVADKTKGENLAYATIREHTRNPPGMMATVVGSDGWSKDVISEAEADAMARWLMEDAPSADKPGDFQEPEAGKEPALSKLAEEFPMPAEDKRIRDQGKKLFERSCGSCHGGTRPMLSAAPGVKPPGEKAPHLAPSERKEVGDGVQTYYHMREHIREAPLLMGHFINDPKSGEVGFSETAFSAAEADAVAYFIATNEGSADSLDPSTGLPPSMELPSDMEPVSMEGAGGAEGGTGGESGTGGGTSSTPGFTALLAAGATAGAAYVLRRRD